MSVPCLTAGKERYTEEKAGREKEKHEKKIQVEKIKHGVKKVIERK
jgi:hypothetical protein